MKLGAGSKRIIKFKGVKPSNKKHKHSRPRMQGKRQSSFMDTFTGSISEFLTENRPFIPLESPYDPSAVLRVTTYNVLADSYIGMVDYRDT